MLTHEKVLKVFGPYLDADPDYEVVKTSRGYTLLAWNNRREEWFSAEFCKTPESLRARLDSYQNAANIPMLLAVDEEGGTVCRISSHTAFREEKFPSPREAYASGGMEMVLAMEWEKGYLLHSLGAQRESGPGVRYLPDSRSLPL